MLVADKNGSRSYPTAISTSSYAKYAVESKQV